MVKDNGNGLRVLIHVADSVGFPGVYVCTPVAPWIPLLVLTSRPREGSAVFGCTGHKAPCTADGTKVFSRVTVVESKLAANCERLRTVSPESGCVFLQCVLPY